MKKSMFSISTGLFWHMIGICGLFLAFMYGYSAFVYEITVDEWEHMQASWMVGQGMVPFRDFFEHHHPLLWYVTAPFVMNHPTILAFFGARLAVLTAFAVNCAWIYGIARILKARRCVAALGVFFYAVCYVTVTEFADFRPDHFMICMMLGGVWFLLRYLQNQRSHDLSTSFFLFFLSFCFLQKIILFFIPLGLLILLLLWEKRETVKDVIVAASIPVICATAYGLYLWGTDSLSAYFELNWLLNKAWFRGYEEPLPLSCQLYVWGGVTITLFLTLRQKIMERRFFLTLTLLYFAVWFAFPKPYHMYYLPVIPFLAVTWGLFVGEYLLKTPVRIWMALAGIGYVMIEAVYYFPPRFNDGTIVHPQQPMTYVLSVLKPDERVVSFSSSFLVPFHRPVSYYWFGLSRGAFWDHMLFDRAPLPDLNRALLDEKTRFVRVGYIYNQQYSDNTDMSHIAYQPDEALLHRYYRPTYYPFIYERKPNSIK